MKSLREWVTGQNLICVADCELKGKDCIFLKKLDWNIAQVKLELTKNDYGNPTGWRIMSCSHAVGSNRAGNTRSISLL